MKYKLPILLIIVITLVLFFIPIVSAQSLENANIDDVPQINQLKLASGKTIELYGLHAEQYSVSNEPIYSEYANGIQLIKSLTQGKSITIQLVENNEYIAWLGDLCLNEIIIKRGYDKVLPKLSSSSIDTSLILAEDEAKSSNIGIWKEVSVTESSQTISIQSSNAWAIIPIIYLLMSVFYFKKAWKIQRYSYLLCALSISNLALFTGSNFMTTITIALAITNGIINIIMIMFLDAYYKKFWQTIISLATTVMIIITIFAGSYLGISMSQPQSETIHFLIAKSQYSESTILKPKTNYLDVPNNYYNNSNSIEPHTIFYNVAPIDALYFSAVTFFTVGYGDITPKGNLRLLTILEMTLGYLLQTTFIAILVARYKVEDIVSEDLVSEDLPSKIKTILLKKIHITFLVLWFSGINFYRLFYDHHILKALDTTLKGLEGQI